MSSDQILRYNYSDDQWWDLPDDHHPHHLQNYQINDTPTIDHAGGRRHDAARLSTSAPQYPKKTAIIQYYDPYDPISSTTTATTTTATTTAAAVSLENTMKQPVQVATSPRKPKRRRGRGGTMATTTFLNSTITNFRELVQKHTGMGSSATPACSSYYTSSCDQKGPITLCFTDYSSSSSTCESALGFHHHRNQY